MQEGKLGGKVPFGAGPVPGAPSHAATGQGSEVSLLSRWVLGLAPRAVHRMLTPCSGLLGAGSGKAEDAFALLRAPQIHHTKEKRS